MLAPSPLPARRLSCSGDYILSRSDHSRLSGGGKGDGCLQINSPSSSSISPSESVHSAPASSRWPSTGQFIPDANLPSPGHLPYPSGGGVESLSSASPSSTPSSTSSSNRSIGPAVTLSPEVRRRHWFEKLSRMKDELDRIGDGFRLAGSSIRDSIDGLLVRMSPTSERRAKIYTVSGGEMGNGVRVEVVREAPPSKHQKRPRVSRKGASSPNLETPLGVSDHNFSTFLMLTSLQDGVFSAELPMDKIPPGHVRIRVCDYKLEIMVLREDPPPVVDKHPVGKHIENGGECVPNTATYRTAGDLPLLPPAVQVMHRLSQISQGSLNTKPTYCGSISLPIYVNPTTLEFSLNSVGSILHMEGRLKGCATGIGGAHSTRLSLSANDVRVSPTSTKYGQHLEVPESATMSRNNSSLSLPGPTTDEFRERNNSMSSRQSPIELLKERRP